MNRLKIFPKTFFYTLAMMIFIVIVAHVLFYFLAPSMAFALGAADTTIELNMAISTQQIILETIKKVFPISFACCVLLSVVCSLLFSRTFTVPIKHISDVTGKMAALDKTAVCDLHSQNEIGVLAENVNMLYKNLLSTIENLELEKERVHESEKSKVDFLRVASHELKTPVTALNAILENMILGVGKYRDYGTYLPECKEMTEQLSVMIHDILETSKAGLSSENETVVETDVGELMEILCEPYQLIAKTHGVVFSLDLKDRFSAVLAPQLFSKAMSNILANGVNYTDAGKKVFAYLDGRSIVVENECVPIPTGEIPRLFEPFYRPDFARSRDDGGNGLGLYIADTLFSSMNIRYLFEPMKKPEGMRFTIWL